MVISSGKLSRVRLATSMLGGLALGCGPVLLSACSRQPLARPATPVEERAAPREGLLPHRAARRAAADPASPPPTPEQLRSLAEMLGPPASLEAAVEQAAELKRQYLTEPEYLPRVEIAYRLADSSTPQAREVLRYLFIAERNLDLRVQMVNSLSLVESEDLVPSLPILQEALKPSQPRELREAALDTILTLNDPGAIPVLQTALIDPDPELAETASKTFDYFQEVLRLKAP